MSQHEWRLQRPSGVRADAPGIFVPASELSGAQVGDIVTIEGADQTDGGERRATVAAQSERDDVTYFRLDFESPR
jgi:hypothetical protein